MGPGFESKPLTCLYLPAKLWLQQIDFTISQKILLLHPCQNSLMMVYYMENKKKIDKKQSRYKINTAEDRSMVVTDVMLQVKLIFKVLCASFH